MKHFLSLLLAVLMLFSLASFAFASEESASGLYNYSDEDGNITGTFTGSGGWIETYVNDSPAGGSKLVFPAAEGHVYQISVYENGSLVYTEAIVVPGTSVMGDINGDSNVNISDALRLFRIVNGQIEDNGSSADINNDGSINVLDALKLFRYVNGQIDSL